MTNGPTAQDVVRLVRSLRLPLHDEKALQADMASRFAARGWPHVREHRLDAKDVVDFYFPGSRVALEVKIKGGRRAIHDQCARYCAHGDVDCLVLATSVATGFPPEVNGKPCYVASLGMGWL